MRTVIVFALAFFVATAAAFKPHAALTNSVTRRAKVVSNLGGAIGAKPIHSEFTVAKATNEQLDAMNVKKWPTWSTAGSEKYQVGVRSALKVYDCNELSYIISGKMEIIPKATGVPVLVEAGDFVTFPDEFACYWHVIEEVKKNWYIYD